MTSVSYEDIFNQFLGLVQDNQLWDMNKDDIAEILTDLLHKSVYASYVYHLFSTVNTDDLTQTLTFEMAHEVNDEVDRQFVTVAIAKWMKYEWLSPQLNSVVNTAQFFGGKEQSFFSQANHVAELRGMTDDAYKQARDFIRDRGYISNSYLSGGVS